MCAVPSKIEREVWARRALGRDKRQRHRQVAVTQERAIDAGLFERRAEARAPVIARDRAGECHARAERAQGAGRVERRPAESWREGGAAIERRQVEDRLADDEECGSQGLPLSVRAPTRRLNA